MIDNPTVPLIFEAAFCFEESRVEILQREPGNEWRLVEVKSPQESVAELSDLQKREAKETDAETP